MRSRRRDRPRLNFVACVGNLVGGHVLPGPLCVALYDGATSLGTFMVWAHACCVGWCLCVFRFWAMLDGVSFAMHFLALLLPFPILV